MTTLKPATSEVLPLVDREAVHASAALGSPAIQDSVSLTEAGLQIGAGSILARMRKGADGRSHPALDADAGRLLALLAVAEGNPVSAHRVIPALDAAAVHWQRGDKALANLRLVFAGLPRLREPADAYRVCLAEHLLDAGMAPDALMQALWPVAALDKYRADEARISAGRPGGGEWTFEVGGTAAPAAGERRIVVAGKPLPPGEGEKEYEERHRSGQSTIEEDAAAGRGIEPTGPLPTGAGSGPAAETQATLRLLSELAKASAEAVGPGRGPVYGTRVHAELKKRIQALGRDDLLPEQSYLDGKPADYGTPKSVRVDAVLGSRKQPRAAFDLKTGGAELSTARITKLRDHMPKETYVSVHQIRP